MVVPAAIRMATILCLCLLFAAQVVAQAPPVAQIPSDRLSSILSDWTARRGAAWKQAQERKAALPRDSQYPGAVGAEANQYLGFVEGVDEAIRNLEQIRSLRSTGERSEALAELEDRIRKRRERHWEQVQAMKRGFGAERPPDRFGAEANQLIGMVEAFDLTLKDIALLRRPDGALVSAEGAFEGEIVLRGKISVTRGTLRLNIAGGRVSGDLSTRFVANNGVATQTATIVGTMTPDGAVNARLVGASKWSGNDERFSGMFAALYAYRFEGELTGSFQTDEGSGKIDARGIGPTHADTKLASSWTVRRIR